jgi:phosphoribosyl 1,2-cyclic phosphodiesterase
MDTRGEMIVRFWGVRGSYPAPGNETTRYGGNTACVEISVNGSTIILDAGTGIIPLGRSLVQRARHEGRRVSALLLFSHLHHDHTQGFPFFTPAFIPGASLAIYGPNLLGSNPLKAYEDVMQPPYFPVRLSDLNASLSFCTLRDSDMIVINQPGEPAWVGPKSADASAVANASARNGQDHSDSVCIRALRSSAHPGGVYHYRIDYGGRSVVYATDTEGYVSGDRRLANFAHGTDLLIHDAQYTDEHYLGLIPGLAVTQGYGHSTVSMACQAALASEVKQLALFHHAPEYNDNQMDEIGRTARTLFPNTIVTQEGLEVHLRPVGLPAALVESQASVRS